MRLLYEGKSKQVFSTDKQSEVLIHFKDSATAHNGLKKDEFKDKGRVNLLFTRYFFDLLEKNGVRTHIISYENDTEVKAKSLKIFPIEVVVRNYAAGSICKRMGFQKGYEFEEPLLEFFFKSDELSDPLIAENEILARELVNKVNLAYIKGQALRINSILRSTVDKKGIILVDFKLEFGKTQDGKVLLGDEISPDSCRFWDKKTLESLDKDVYREDKGNLIQSYSRLADILGVKL